MSEEVTRAAGDLAYWQRQAEGAASMIITFDPPLPCSTIDGDHQCGRPATVATLYPTGGGYLMQPICRACVAGLARVYPPEQKASEE